MEIDKDNEKPSSTGRDALKLIAIMGACIAVPWMLIKAIELLF